MTPALKTLQVHHKSATTWKHFALPPSLPVPSCGGEMDVEPYLEWPLYVLMIMANALLLPRILILRILESPSLEGTCQLMSPLDTGARYLALLYLASIFNVYHFCNQESLWSFISTLFNALVKSTPLSFDIVATILMVFGIITYNEVTSDGIGSMMLFFSALTITLMALRIIRT